MSTGDPAYKLEKVFELLAWLFLPLVSGHVLMASPALPVRSLALSSSSLVGSAWVGGSRSAQLPTHGTTDGIEGGSSGDDGGEGGHGAHGARTHTVMESMPVRPHHPPKNVSRTLLLPATRTKGP